jgi:AraC-like DNA-binding protein
MLKLALILFNIIVFLNVGNGEISVSSNSTLIESDSHVQTSNTTNQPSTENSATITPPIKEHIGNHNRKHKIHVKKVSKDIEKSRSTLLNDFHNSTENNASVITSKTPILIKERPHIIHRVNSTETQIVENATLSKLDSPMSFLNSSASFLKDEYESMTPAWLVGLAIIGFVLTIFLIACFVSIGFSMVDVSF